jgi:hypothetical protein
MYSGAENKSALEVATESEDPRELPDEDIDRIVAAVILDGEQEELYAKVGALTPSR